MLTFSIYGLKDIREARYSPRSNPHRMNFKTIIRLLSLAFVALSITPVQAAPKKPKPTPKTTPAETVEAPKKAEPKPEEVVKKRPTYPLYGDVVAIDAKTLTLKGGEGQPNRVFAMTEETKIVNGEKDAQWTDTKIGQKIGGLVEKAEAGNDKLLKINLGVKQDKAPEKPQPKVEPAKTEEKKVEEKPKIELKPKKKAA